MFETTLKYLNNNKNIGDRYEISKTLPITPFTVGVYE